MLSLKIANNALWFLVTNTCKENLQENLRFELQVEGFFDSNRVQIRICFYFAKTLINRFPEYRIPGEHVFITSLDTRSQPLVPASNFLQSHSVSLPHLLHNYQPTRSLLCQPTQPSSPSPSLQQHQTDSQ